MLCIEGCYRVAEVGGVLQAPNKTYCKPMLGCRHMLRMHQVSELPQCQTKLADASQPMKTLDLLVFKICMLTIQQFHVCCQLLKQRKMPGTLSVKSRRAEHGR